MTHRAVNDILKQRFLHATLSMAPTFLKEMTHWESLSKSMTLAVCVCVCVCARTHTHAWRLKTEGLVMRKDKKEILSFK